MLAKFGACSFKNMILPAEPSIFIVKMLAIFRAQKNNIAWPAF